MRACADALAEWVIDREQGSRRPAIRLRAMLLPVAWLWLRHQPGSVLSPVVPGLKQTGVV